MALSTAEIPLISSELLQSVSLSTAFPVIYDLRSVLENNDWHLNQDVFEHTLSVLKALEEIMKSAGEFVSLYLDTVIEQYTRRVLLVLATLFHDIGKREVLVSFGDKTSTKGHEAESAEITQQRLDDFDLTDIEKEFVLQVIAQHGAISDLVEPSQPDKYETLLEEFKAANADIFLAICLLGKADLQGSQWGQTHPDDFAIRLNRYNQIIETAESSAS